MKIFLPLIAAMLCLSVSTANAQVNFTFSTSSESATAGSTLDVNDGETGSLFVFIENNDASGNGVDGVSLDITDLGGPSALTTSGFVQENPGGNRWILGTSPGTFNTEGFLVDDSNAGGFLLSDASGIQNGVGPVFFATLTFDANTLGSNTLGFAEGAAAISVSGQAPQSLNFGTATVNVVTPEVIPEPSSLALVGSIFGAALLRRRRRN